MTTPTPAAGQAGQAEARYGITLTGAERTLLTSPKDLLGVLDRQRRFILTLALEPVPCPACGTVTCRRAACTRDWDTDASIPDDAYACRNEACRAALIWRMGLIGGDQWFDLAPGQTITITRPAPVYDPKAGH